VLILTVVAAAECIMYCIVSGVQHDGLVAWGPFLDASLVRALLAPIQRRCLCLPIPIAAVANSVAISVAVARIFV